MDSAICAILTLLIAIFAADSFSAADDDGNGSQLMAIYGNGWMVKWQHGKRERHQASPLLIADSLSVALPLPPLSIACPLCGNLAFMQSSLMTI